MTPTDKQTVFRQLAELARENVPDEGFTIHEEPDSLTVTTAGPITINGREKDSMELLSVIIQKRHIGFYFMPVYVSNALKATLSDEMDAMLKGKSCFHVKAELFDNQKATFASLIQQGVALYQENAWV